MSGWRVLMSSKRLNEDAEDFVELAVRMGAVEAKAVDPKSIVVRDWVRLKCQYGCGNYGKSLTCPPFSPTPEQTRKALKGYSSAILMKVRDESISTHDMIAKLERHVFLSGYHSAFGLVAGPCERCKKCNLQHCVYPRLARPSLESSDIDVYATARRNGFHIEVLKTRRQKPTYFGLLLIQ
jgi:predicted metal-binding protein